MGSFGHAIPGRAGTGRRPLMGAIAGIVVVLAAMATAGCAQGTAASTTSAQQVPAAPGSSQAAVASSQGPKALPALTKVQQITAASITAGRLVFSGGCFYLAPLGNGDRRSLVWPYGYTARTGPLGVYDGQGKLIARPGDKVSLGGAGTVRTDIRAGTVTHPACLAGTKDAWIIGSVGHS